MIADVLPSDAVLDQLVSMPDSLKNLGLYNDDGWGLAYYNGCEPFVKRGVQSAYVDANFTLAAQEVANSSAFVGVGHVRIATSGATGIPDPHPFMRFKDGKWWAFGHNGGLDKNGLKTLIGEEYLSQNPPTVGDSWDDPLVVDSDLYMLYVLKCIEDSGWNSTLGVAKAVIDISTANLGTMNFFLTDGETLWGFRYGNTLYYYWNETSPQYSAIASQPPLPTEAKWTEVNDFCLVTLTKDKPPQLIEDIRTIPEFNCVLTLPVFAAVTPVTVVLLRRKQGRC
jgi:predicted glutamine amidotransferase